MPKNANSSSMSHKFMSMIYKRKKIGDIIAKKNVENIQNRE